MMTLRAFDARMLMAQRQGKTSFYMQHLGEEAVGCAFRKALAARRHELPDLPPAGLLIAGGYPMVDMMSQIYLQRARSAEGPPAAGDVLVAASTASSRSRATSRRSSSRRSAGRWRRRSSGDTQDRRRLDRRRRDRRVRLPRRAGLRLDLPGAGDPQHRQQPVGDLDLPGHRPRRLGHLRRARPRLRHPGAARRRQRLPRRVCRGAMGGRAGARATSGRR